MKGDNFKVRLITNCFRGDKSDELVVKYGYISLADMDKFRFEEEYTGWWLIADFDNQVDFIDQSTWWTDCNGVMAFTHDILIGNEPENKTVGVMQRAGARFGVNWDYSKNPDPEWRDGCLYGGWGQYDNLRGLEDRHIFEHFHVAGNVWQHPELLGG